MNNNFILSIGQIVIAGLLIAAILLQQRGQALGTAFGGGGEFYSTRRGLQKRLHQATIVLGALFILLAVLNLVL